MTLNSFLFAPINSKWLSLFRFLFALMLGYMFAPRGLEPVSILKDLDVLYGLVSSNGYFILLYILIILFALGVNSRIITPLLFIIALPHVFLSSGSDSKQAILCALFCFSFLKSVPVWAQFKNDYTEEFNNPFWPLRLIQVQLTLVYGVNAIAKSSYHYLSGEALKNMSIYMDNFNMDLSSGYFPMGNLEIPLYIMAIGSVLVEYFLAIGLWFGKTKWIAVIVGISFHAYLTTILSIFMLDFVSMFLYLAFIIPFARKNFALTG